MRNGIYLFMILFLGIIGYFTVNDLYSESSYSLAGIIFMIVSFVIFELTTHLKKQENLSSAQVNINVIYITIFAFYGFISGIGLLMGFVDVNAIKYEGVIFILSSAFLMYGVYIFMKKQYKKLSH